ncbi:NTP transferase domain-containing protein [Peptoniphilus mikwangii]|uniref:NTP transferase domain-containing protein n=1 Tax=Peptoniphilus mikwangii TaxID=1354300 RepID=UPI0004178919|nr:NTP transferase domain-containing protein [Peptoniphilus mikwangii]
MKLGAIIMASGFSRRMGENKLKLNINNKKIFEYTVDLIYKYDFEDKIIVSNDEEIIRYSQEKGIRAYKNKNAIVGKSESIKIGISNTQNVDGYMFFVCDQPFLSIETIDEIVSKFKKNNKLITYPVYGNKMGTPVIFPTKYKDELLKLSFDEGGVKLIDKENSQGVFIEREYEYFDIDDKEDYRIAVKYEK